MLHTSGVNTGIYQGASAMNAAALWQQAISENIAASAVPGYKKQQVTFEGVRAGLLGAQSHQMEVSPQHYSQPTASLRTDFSQGIMRPTGSKTDLAIEGNGFFEVQLPDGKMAYTRDGEFRLSPQGQLVTKDGYPVASDSGTLQVDLKNPGTFTVSNTGEASQGNQNKGKIRLVEFTDPSLLAPMGGGYFTANDPKLQPKASAASSVRQGFVEASNGSVVEEMTNLMMAMRSFEANQKVIQIHDERVNKAINELAPS